jgi:hypothetical protein
MEFAVAKAKTQIEAVAETTFTTVLLNQYRDGKTVQWCMLTTKRIRYKSNNCLRKFLQSERFN